MTNIKSTTGSLRLIRKYRVYLIWILIIGIYFYRVLLPEVLFVNGSGITVDYLQIAIPGDDEVWRNIEHGKSKTFRYQPVSLTGSYNVSITLSDGTVIRGNYKAIEPWDLGHKAIFELSPDLELRADFNYSFFE